MSSGATGTPPSLDYPLRTGDSISGELDERKKWREWRSVQEKFEANLEPNVFIVGEKSQQTSNPGCSQNSVFLVVSNSGVHQSGPASSACLQ